MTAWYIVLGLVAAWFILVPIIVMAYLAVRTVWEGGSGPSDPLSSQIPPWCKGLKDWRP